MVLSAIKKRRSIRKYSEKKVNSKHLNEILKAGQFAPSGRNLKEWEFIVVKDKKLLKKLSNFKKSGANHLASADVGIVVLGDKKLNSLWVEDCSIAAGYMMLEATALGLGSCWIEVRKTRHNPQAEKDVRNILKIPEKYGVLCILALGYPNEKKVSHSDKDFNKTKIHYEKF